MRRQYILPDNQLITQAIITVVGLITIFIIRALIKKIFFSRIDEPEKKYQLRKIISFASWFIIIFFLSVVFYQRLGNLTVAVGAVSAGIAFSLQEVIVSIAGWLAITFGHFFRVGDRVQLGGIKGDVIDITLLRTTLMECGEWIKGDLYTGRMVRIANSFVFKEPVFNYSGNFPFLWDEISLPVKYGSDIKFTRNLLEKIAVEVTENTGKSAGEAWLKLQGKYIIEEGSVMEPVVTLTANDNWVEFTVRYTVNYRVRRTTKDKLFTRILEELDIHKDKTGIASTSLQLVNPPVFTVKLSATTDTDKN